MSEYLNNQNIWKFQMLTTEELKQILKSDAMTGEEHPYNEEEILSVLEVLESRETGTSQSLKTAHRAFRSFQEHYCPFPAEQQRKKETVIQTIWLQMPLWIKRTAASAAVIMLVVLCNLTANALYGNFQGKPAYWNEDSFFFPPADSGTVSCQSAVQNESDDIIQKILTDAGLPWDMVPSEIPEGYHFQDSHILNTAQGIKVIIRFQTEDGSGNIKLQVSRTQTKNPQIAEKDEGTVSLYTEGDLECYLFRNHDSHQAGWVARDCECYIFGGKSEEMVKRMIQSIPNKTAD